MADARSIMRVTAWVCGIALGLVLIYMIFNWIMSYLYALLGVFVFLLAWTLVRVALAAKSTPPAES